MQRLRYNKAFRDVMLLLAIFLLGTIALIVFPIISKIQYDNLVSNMKSVEATIVDIDLDINVRGPDEQEIYITYEVDGIVYNRELSTDTTISFAAGTGADYSVGDKLCIFYNPKNPNEIATPRSVDVGYGVLTFGLISFALLLLSLILILKNRQKFLVTEEEYEKEKRKRKNTELLNKKGKKIRWQYFNTCIYFYLTVIPAVLVMIVLMELKEGIFDIGNFIHETARVTPALLVVFIGPFLVLSILNRFCFGKVLGVMDNSTLFLNDREIDITNIIEIMYHPGVLSRSKIHFCCATFVVRAQNGGTESFDVIHFPLYGLREIKKQNYNIKLCFDKSIWFLMFGPTVIFAVLALLLG